MSEGRREVTWKKWAEFSYKAYVLGRILDAMPPNFPSIRELRIQNAKLQRMLNKPSTEMGALGQKRLFFGELSLKKDGKRQGRYAVQVSQQARKVDSMAESSFKGWLREGRLKEGRTFTNAEFREWHAKFKSALEASAKEMHKQVRDKVTLLLGKR